MDSIRLQQIVNLIPDGVGVADIGTDHAQIPIYLANHTHCRPIIAGEKTSGPYRTAQYWLKDADLLHTVDLRLGSGLTILKPGEVSWAVIAGMGYRTIVEILEESQVIARSLDGLILQPMQDVAELRRWLSTNGYTIVDERLVKEEGKLFQIILIKAGEPIYMEEIFYEVGQVLFTKADPLLGEHIANLIKYYESVHSRIRTDSCKARERLQQLTAKVAKLKEVLDLWQKKRNA